MDSDNSQLTKEIIMEEAWKAVKQISPLKAPRPNGMHVIL